VGVHRSGRHERDQSRFDLGVVRFSAQ
jgi:hypothetical protein